MPFGAISKSWWARAATILIVGFVGLVVGIFAGHALAGVVFGAFLGVACVVMGESSMDTGSYKYPAKYF